MFVSLVLVKSLVVELEARGHRTANLLRAVNLDRARLSDAAEGLRYRDFNRLVGQAYELSDDPALGLKVGLQASKLAMHVLGLLVVTSPTIREAHRQLTRYGDLVVSELDWQLSEREQQACLSFAFATESNEANTHRFLAECLIALALRFGRRFALSETEHEVWFQHAEPDYSADYERLLHCPARFRQSSNAIVFPRAVLEREQLHADSKLHTLLTGFADNLKAELRGETTFEERVRIALRYQTDLAKVDNERLARRWGLSRRALRRRLTTEGVSLSELLDEARLQRALQELKRPECKIKELADDLGYSETSAFHRAFKRWTGRTPTEYRAHLLERPLRTGLAAAR